MRQTSCNTYVATHRLLKDTFIAKNAQNEFQRTQELKPFVKSAIPVRNSYACYNFPLRNPYSGGKKVKPVKTDLIKDKKHCSGPSHREMQTACGVYGVRKTVSRGILYRVTSA